MLIFEIRKGANMKTNLTGKGAFRTHKSVSPEEIISAGGTTAFGVKAGKNNESLKRALKNSPEPEPFTEEEWTSLMQQVSNDK
jgi:hypothetical protein